MTTRIAPKTVLTIAALALLASPSVIAQESETHQVGEMTLTSEDAENLPVLVSPPQPTEHSS